MKKVLFPTLAALGVAFNCWVDGCERKISSQTKLGDVVMDTVPDSPKKVQFVSYLLDLYPIHRRKSAAVSYMLDSVPDSPKKKVQQYVNIKSDTVPDSPENNTCIIKWIQFLIPREN